LAGSDEVIVVDELHLLIVFADVVPTTGVGREELDWVTLIQTVATSEVSDEVSENLAAKVGVGDASHK
jgi:hypothetical protein